MPWILLIVLLVLVLFSAGALVLTLGLMSTRGKIEPLGGHARGRPEPGEFRHALKILEPKQPPEIQPQDKKAS